MYAAILSHNEEIDFEDLKMEISNCGWQVVGTEIEYFDDAPSNVMVWVLFGVKPFKTGQFDYGGYVRIASEDPLPQIIVANSSWLAVAYYKVLMWILYGWHMLKFTLAAQG